MSFFADRARLRRKRLRTWSGSERPFTYRRLCRIRAHLQHSLVDLAETRDAVNCVRKVIVAIDGLDYWELFEPMPTHAIYRIHLEQHRVIPWSERKRLRRAA